jgi:hypothetical protein
VGQGGEAQPAGVTHVGGQVAAGDLTQGGDQLEQPAVGTLLEQSSMPIVLEIQAAGEVAPGVLDLAVQLQKAANARLVGGG